jgi:hypothetical protein
MKLDIALAATGVRLLGLCMHSRPALAIAQARVPARPALMWAIRMWAIRKAGPVAGIDDGAQARAFINDACQHEHTIALIRSIVDLSELEISACVVA